MRKGPLWAIAVIMTTTVACTPATALVLAGLTTPSQATAILDPCPKHAGYYCIATAHPIELLGVGPNDYFLSAWSTAITQIWDPSTWQLNWAATPVDATLNITTYQAYNLPSGAGAEIRVQWTPTSDQQDLQWIQALHTNRPSRTTSQNYLDAYINRPPKDMPPAYPYSFSDYRFYDMPGRSCEADKHIYWDSYLYLTRIDRTAKSVTVYEGLYWGWTLDCLPVPEPGGIVQLLVGCLGVLGLRLARARHQT